MRTGPAMTPLEAHEELLRFARLRGRGVLNLLLHAAVPQSIRPDLLSLIRINFVPEADDPAAEADILLAPFCEDLGSGYFQLDPELRRQCLDHLVDFYAEEPIPGHLRVANLLLAYIEHSDRTSGIRHDALLRDWTDVQYWVASAFIDPDGTATAFARAMEERLDGKSAAACVQFGSLAAAIAIPLGRHHDLLTYAAGFQAAATGDLEAARRLLGSLDDEDLRIGPVTLQSPRKVLRQSLGEGTSEAPELSAQTA